MTYKIIMYKKVLFSIFFVIILFLATSNVNTNQMKLINFNYSANGGHNGSNSFYLITSTGQDFVSTGNTVYALAKDKTLWTYTDQSNITSISGFSDITNDGIDDIVVITKSLFSPSIKILNGKTGEVIAKNNDYIKYFNNQIPITVTRIINFNHNIYVATVNKIYLLNKNVTLTEKYMINESIDNIFVVGDNLIIKTQQSLYALNSNFDLIKKYNSKQIFSFNIENNKIIITSYQKNWGYQKLTFDPNLDLISSEQTQVHQSGGQTLKCGNSTYNTKNNTLYVDNIKVSDYVHSEKCDYPYIYFIDENNKFIEYNIKTKTQNIEYNLPKGIDPKIINEEIVFETTNNGFKVYKNGKLFTALETTKGFSEIIDNQELTIEQEYPFKYTFKGYTGKLPIDKNVNIDKIMDLGDIDKDGYREIVLYPKTYPVQLKSSLIIFRPEKKQTININFAPSYETVLAILKDFDKNISDINSQIQKKQKEQNDLYDQIYDLKNQITQKDSEITDLKNKLSITQELFDTEVAKGLDANKEKKEIKKLNAQISDLKEEYKTLLTKQTNLQNKENAKSPEIANLQEKMYKLQDQRYNYEISDKSDMTKFATKLIALCGKEVFAVLQNGFVYKENIKTKEKSRYKFVEQLRDVNNISFNNIGCLSNLNNNKENDLLLFSRENKKTRLVAIDTDKNKIIYDKNINVNGISNAPFYTYNNFIILPTYNGLYIYNSQGILQSHIKISSSQMNKIGGFLIYSTYNSDEKNVAFTKDNYFTFPYVETPKESLGVYDCDKDNKEDIVLIKNKNDSIYLECYNKDFSKEYTLIDKSNPNEQYNYNYEKTEKIKITGNYLTIMNYGSLFGMRYNSFSNFQLNTIINLDTKSVFGMSSIVPNYKDNKLYLGSQEITGNPEKIIDNVYNTENGIAVKFNSKYDNVRKVIFIKYLNSRNYSSEYEYFTTVYGNKTVLNIKKGEYKLLVILTQNGLFITDEKDINSNYSPNISILAVISLLGIIGLLITWVVIRWMHR